MKQPDSSYWYDSSGPDAAFVVSTKVRLARNTSEFAFPHRLEKQQAVQLLARSERYVRSLPEIELKAIDTAENVDLLQHRFVSKDGGCGFTVNDKDHFRLWALKPGLDLIPCLDILKSWDRSLEKTFNLAVNLEWGYLSPLLNNLGTAMSARIILHLPALARSLDTNALVASIEGASDSDGVAFESIGQESGFFVLRNTETLGSDEYSILNKLGRIVRLLIHYELETLKILRKRDFSFFDDSVWRAIAILRNCRKIELSEAWKLLGDVRLGLNSGVLLSESPSNLSERNIAAAFFRALLPRIDLDAIERARIFREVFNSGVS